MKKLAMLANASMLAYAGATAPKTPEAPAAAPTAKPSAPVITGTLTLPQPDRSTKKGGQSQFPFASLTAPGMAFGVKDRTAKSMAQIISTQNRRNLTDKKDDAGNVVYKTKEIAGEGGNKVVVPTTEPERIATKRFYAFDVTAEYAEANLKGTPLEGSSVLIFREV